MIYRFALHAAAFRGVQQASTYGAGSSMLWAMHVRSCTLTWARLGLCATSIMMPVGGRASKPAAADLPAQKAYQT